jgi:hypothetical protein
MMHRIAVITLFASFIWFNSTAACAQDHIRWRSFTSRSGWSIDYPADWSIASCHSCADPRARNVYVDFLPPDNQDSDGWVMVEPLASKPQSKTVDSWLTEIAASSNQNPQSEVRKLKIAGLPALRVRYRQSEGSEVENVYVTNGHQTFSIGFSGESLRAPIAALPRHALFDRMIETFRVNQP